MSAQLQGLVANLVGLPRDLFGERLDTGLGIVAVCWIVGYMLLRLWWIAMLVYVQRKLVKTGKIEKSKVRWHDMSVPEAIRHYFNWGLQQAVRRRRPFIGILRWLNVFVNLVQLRWVRLSLIKPLLTCAFYAATWLITLPIATFYLNARFDAEDALKPMWASARANEPSKPERTTAV